MAAKKRWKWSEVREHGGKVPEEVEAAVDPRQKIGRCDHCGHANFSLHIHKRHLLRKCRACDQVVDTDDEMKIIRKGGETA